MREVNRGSYCLLKESNSVGGEGIPKDKLSVDAEAASVREDLEKLSSLGLLADGVRKSEL